MNWYKFSSGKSQQEYHERMVAKYKDKIRETKKLVKKYKKRDDDKKVEMYKDRIDKFEENLNHHEDRVFYYNHRDKN